LAVQSICSADTDFAGIEHGTIIDNEQNAILTKPSPNQSHACKQVAEGRSNPHPPMLAMIHHFPTRTSTRLANTVHSAPPPGA